MTVRYELHDKLETPDTASEKPRRNVLQAMLRGAGNRCMNCGKGKVFDGFLQHTMPALSAVRSSITIARTTPRPISQSPLSATLSFPAFWPWRCCGIPRCGSICLSGYR